jgi:predicted ribosomally synthesized peptide with nif11-like leader
MTVAVILVIPGEIMSLEDVKAFYQRLGTDEAFRAQIQGVNSKDECSQTVKSAGYDFSQEELEEYTVELLELSADEDGLADLDEKELATVFGGMLVQPMYGVIRPPIDWPIDWPKKWPPKKWSPIDVQPSYGVVISPTDLKPVPGITDIPVQPSYGVVVSVISPE